MIFPSIDTVGADISVPGGDITSTATTFNLLNATVTTLNIGGAATTVSIGAGAASTLNANFTTQINLNTAAIVSNQTTVALLNTTTTTVNAFGAATAISLGAATGTLTLNNPSVRFADGSAAAPSITFGAASNTGIFYGDGTMEFSAGGVKAYALGGGGLRILSTLSLGWSSNPGVAGPDVVLERDAANTLALRNGVNAQQFNIYSTYTDATNYEGGYLTAAAGSVTLGGRTAGTGTDDIYLVLSPAGAGTVVGSTAANGDLTLEGTSHATKTTSYVILQPTSGNVGIGTTGPQNLLHLKTTATVLTSMIDLETGANGSGGQTDLGGVLFSSSSNNPHARIYGGRDVGYGGYLYLQTNSTTQNVWNTAVTINNQGDVGIGVITPATLLELENVTTITGAVTDGYSAALTLDPGYTAATALTVTRHNYIDVQNVSVAGAGPAAVTDACIFRLDAALGTHKATVGATTKTTPGGVDGWLKHNVNGVVLYSPLYLSTTA